MDLEEFTPPNWRFRKIKRRLLQKDLEFYLVITKQQVPIKQQFQYNIQVVHKLEFDAKSRGRSAKNQVKNHE